MGQKFLLHQNFQADFQYHLARYFTTYTHILDMPKYFSINNQMFNIISSKKFLSCTFCFFFYLIISLKSVTTSITFSFHIGQFNVVSQRLQHLHKGLIHNAILFFDDAINIPPRCSDCFRKPCLGCSVLYAFYFYIYFYIVFNHIFIAPIRKPC